MESKQQKDVEPLLDSDDVRCDADRENGVLINGSNELDASEELIEQLDLTANMEEHIQQCHERLREFCEELERRGMLITQLRGLLSGTLTLVSDVQEEEKSANNELEVLKCRVHAAAELLGCNDLSKDCRSTKDRESPTDHPEPETIGSVRTIGVHEAAVGKYQQDCMHANALHEVRDMVKSGLKSLEVNSSTMDHLSKDGLCGEIQYIIECAMSHKQMSNFHSALLKSERGAANAFEVTLLEREEELKNVKAQSEALRRELMRTKERANELEKEVCTVRECFVNNNEGTITSGKFSGTVPGNDSISQEVCIDNCIKLDFPQSVESGDISNLNASGLLPERGHLVSQTQVSGDCTSKEDIRSDDLRECDGESVETNKSNSMLAQCKSNESGLCFALLGLENAEELLLDLGTKARESVITKKILKVTEDRRDDLENELGLAFEFCDVKLNQCQNAEFLAANLQNDLENLLCKHETSARCQQDVSETDHDSTNVALDHNFINLVGVQRVNLLRAIINSAAEFEDEIISRFLERASLNMDSIYDVINSTIGRNSNNFYQEEMARLKTSLQRDISVISLYIKRKGDILTHLKSSIEAEYFLLELKNRVNKNVWKQDGQPNDLRKEVISGGDKDLVSYGDHLKSFHGLYVEMDCVNSQVIKCLKHFFEQELESQTALIKSQAQGLEALRQQHTTQLDDIRNEMREKTAVMQEKTEDMLSLMCKASQGIDTSDTNVMETLKSELEWEEVDDKQKRVIESLTEILRRIAAEQISTAAKANKDFYDQKLGHEISQMRTTHEEEIESLKSAFEQEKLTELLLLRKEMRSTNQGYVREIIMAVKSQLKDVISRCHDLALQASMANAAALDELRENIVADCKTCIKELSGMKLQSLEDQAAAIEKAFLENNDAGKSSPLEKDNIDHIHVAVQLQVDTIEELMKRLEAEKNHFCTKLLEIQGENNLMLKEPENGKDNILVTGSKCYSEEACTAMAAGDGTFISDINAIKDELKAKYEKDMECLRLYFEQKCADLEKRYSDEVKTRRSQKFVGARSNESSRNQSPVSSDNELELDQLFVSQKDNVKQLRNPGLDCKRMNVNVPLAPDTSDDEQKKISAKNDSEEMYFRNGAGEVESEEINNSLQKKLIKDKLEVEAHFNNVMERFNQKINDVLHQLKENLCAIHHEEVEKLKRVLLNKDAYCEELKLLFGAELDGLRGNFEARLKENVQQAKNAVDKTIEENIQAQFGHGDKKLLALRKRPWKESEGVQQEPSEIMKKSMTFNSELLNPVMLEHQVDMLKRGIDSDFNDRFSRSECMGRDILTLKLQVKQMEQSKNVLLSRFGEANVDVDDATSVTLLNTDLDKLLKDRDKWKKASLTLRKLLKDVLNFTHVCEDELNGTIVQSILRLSGESDEYILSKENAGVVKQPRRVHFAPERLPNILQDDDLAEEEREDDVVSRLEESGEEIRIELRHCLARLRAEASAILGLSTNLVHTDEERLFNNNTHSQQELIDKISCLENYLKLETMEKDRLKVELHTAKGLCEGHAAAQISLQARLTQNEAQLNALLAKKAQRDVEGYGEASTTPSHLGQLQKFSQLREKAQWVLKDYHRQGGVQVGLSGTLVAQLIEELCNEGDRLSEEARKEKEDLQLQIEAADKQLRSTRAFLEEQAVEREQEREEFQRELDQLHEVLDNRERGRERITKEMESLEQQSNERSLLLEETVQKKEELEVELKAAVDKIWELREIIRELEGQFEGSLLLEKDLRSKNERLAAEFTLQGKKLNDLIEELESLRSSLGYSLPGEMENEGHAALLEKALRNHCLQVEQVKAMGPSLKDLSKKIFKIGVRIDKKTKEIEALQVTLATCNNCTSPSEDVSIREQLEQNNWRMGSPAEDNMSDPGAEGSEEENDQKLSTSIPHVPLRELNLLEEKCNRHFQAQEPLLKRIHDLEMQIHSLRHNEEELTMEREVLQSQVAEQLLHVSELQARLDEARRRGGRQVHCMTVTPLPSSPVSHSPIGSPSTTPDQPSFCCAGLADARHEINNLSQYLEKKELEVVQLKSALENSKKVVANQENQLMNKAREEALTVEKLEELQRLKSEMDELQEKLSHTIKIDCAAVPFSVLLDDLLTEKNEEIDFLGSQVANLKALLAKTSNESKTPKSVQFSDESLEVRLISPSSKASLSLSDGIEVMRDCMIREQSIEKTAIIKHDNDSHKGWLHSTKIEAKDLSGSPGLAVSPLTPYVRNVQELVNDPVLQEESLDKSPTCHQSDVSDPKEEQHSITKNEQTCKTVQDVEVQTTEMEDFEASLKMKKEEIDVLMKRVNEVTTEKNNLSTLVSELREKIDWHSRHLEKLEEESLGRDSMINEIQAENDSLQTALNKLELEMEILKGSNSSLQNEIFKKEEQVKLLIGKVDNYSQANKEQHMLLKATQQERKDILSMIDTLRNETRNMSECAIGSSSSISSEKQTSSSTKDMGSSQQKSSSRVESKVSLREMIMQLVEEVRYVRNEINNLASQKEQLWQDLEKALKSKEDLQEKLNTLKISNGNEGSDAWCQLPDQNERASSPSSVSLEQMIEKVQQEGIEILSLSEIAAGRRSTPCSGNHMFTATPLGSPVGEMMNVSDHGLELSPVKSRSDVFSEEERVQLLNRIQVLENELSHKEREETRNRDWLEFIEKEGNAGWASFLETVGQSHRHKLEILKRLGEQRNARAQYEAEVASLKQQLSQIEAEEHKAVYRLGMERSHVIRLESALQQEKSNFSQLQVSLDKERKRADEAKLINSKVTKALQNELNQYQVKLTQLVESLNQEHSMRKNLEEQLKQLQEALRDGRGAGEDQGMRLRALANDERLQLKKMEEDCERKALEQELEDEKQKRMEYQQEVLKLKEILETRPTQEPVENARWCSTASTPYHSESSFSAEDTLQNLKGVNRILGSHVRQKYEYTNAIAASLESEKNYLEAKCCHLEQKVVALKDELAIERSLWANEKANLLRDHQYLLEASNAIPQHASSKEIYRLQDSLKKLYAHYWRSERNRKALIWQKWYFLTLLSNYRIFKVETITELSKVTDEQRNVVDKITKVSDHSKGKSLSSQSSKCNRRNRKSFRVVVFTVIAISKMKVLVLRSLTGIRSGCRSIVEDALLPTYVHHSQNHPHVYQPLPYSSGSTRPSHYNVQHLSPHGISRNTVHDLRYHHLT